MIMKSIYRNQEVTSICKQCDLNDRDAESQPFKSLFYFYKIIDKKEVQSQMKLYIKDRCANTGQ